MEKDVLTIREAVKRARAEGLPVSEYALRKWVKSGEIPHRSPGSKALIYWPHVAAYIKGEDIRPAAPQTAAAPGIRRVEV